MKTRSALSIQKDVIFALFLRDLRERFSGLAFGSAWLVLEPLLVMGLMIVLIGSRGGGQFGYAEPPVFILAGMVAYRQLVSPTMKQVMGAVKGFQRLRMFRQISEFDLMVARALVCLGIYVAVVAVLTLGLLWLGFSPWPDDILMVLAGSLMGWLLGIGLGIVFANSTYFSAELVKLINIIQFPLMILSAVLYPMTIVPVQFHAAFYYNPFVHVSEWLREYWFEQYHSPVLDIWYLAIWVLVSFALGLALLRINRHREIPQ